MQEKFTKEDLRVGMLVQYRDGRLNLIFPFGDDNELILVGKAIHGQLKNYNNDLLDCDFKNLDIIKVYSRNKLQINYTVLNTEGRTLLWERKEEPEYMTFWDAINCKYMKHENMKEYVDVSLYDKETVLIKFEFLKDLDKKAWLGTNII